MKLLEQLRMLERLDQLIRMKATGTPQELADRLKISERQTYRLIGNLKSVGMPVCYCKSKRSYYYSSDVRLKIELEIEEMPKKR